MNKETPLIWTERGNLPLEALQYDARWEVTDDYIKFIEVYRSDGEVVRESAHVLSLKGYGTMMSDTANF